VNDTDGNGVEQTLRIRARPETVWRFWTDPQRMCQWWGAVAELDPQPGGVYRVEMGTGPIMRGEYLVLEPYERLVFSFGWEPTDHAPDVAPGSSRVEVTLVADGGDTILTLRHTGIATQLADEHAAGWLHFLPRLAAVATATEQQDRPA
jgi:uncharacterized protein YndB with AHSA1/START domain